jgi:hypothetical protein
MGPDKGNCGMVNVTFPFVNGELEQVERETGEPFVESWAVMQRRISSVRLAIRRYK